MAVLWATLVLIAAFVVLVAREASSARRRGPRRPPGPYERGQVGEVDGPPSAGSTARPTARPGNKGAAPRR